MARGRGWRQIGWSRVGSQPSGGDLTAAYWLGKLPSPNDLPNAIDVSGLADGSIIKKGTVGGVAVPLAAVANTDYLFANKSQVLLGGPSQVFSIPVANGETNGLIVSWGRLLINAASNVTVLQKINSSATNVHSTEMDGNGSVAGAGNGRVAVLQNSGAFAAFDMWMYTAHTANGYKRIGQVRFFAENGAGGSLTVWCSGFSYDD